MKELGPITNYVGVAEYCRDARLDLRAFVWMAESNRLPVGIVGGVRVMRREDAEEADRLIERESSEPESGRYWPPASYRLSPPEKSLPRNYSWRPPAPGPDAQ